MADQVFMADLVGRSAQVTAGAYIFANDVQALDLELGVTWKGELDVGAHEVSRHLSPDRFRARMIAGVAFRISRGGNPTDSLGICSGARSRSRTLEPRLSRANPWLSARGLCPPDQNAAQRVMSDFPWN
jgi:hypothetical protein